MTRRALHTGLMLYATAPFTPGDWIMFSTTQEKNIEARWLFRTNTPPSLKSSSSSARMYEHSP
jgi:hypothetical protein